MIDYDYAGLVALSAVAREGSFEKAAASLNVTQSAVSQRVKQLEERTGALLIVRGRPCRPTEIGLQLCNHVEQVRLLQRELSDRMAELSGDETRKATTIPISVNNDSLATWFPNVVRRASSELDVRFEILPDDQEHTEARLKSGEALAVVTTSENTLPGCRRLSLGSMDYIAVASPDFYRENFNGPVTLQDIAGTNCIFFDRKDTIQDQWMTLCFGETVETAMHMVPSYEGYLACCLNGAGWGLVPEIACAGHLEERRLVELSPGQRVKVSLHWQTTAQTSRLLANVGEIVLAEAARHLSSDRFRQIDNRPFHPQPMGQGRNLRSPAGDLQQHA